MKTEACKKFEQGLETSIPNLEEFGAWDQLVLLRNALRRRMLTDDEQLLYRRLWEEHGDKWSVVHSERKENDRRKQN